MYMCFMCCVIEVMESGSAGPPVKRLRQSALNFGVSSTRVRQSELDIKFPNTFQVIHTPTDGNSLSAAISDQMGRSMTDCNIVGHEIVQHVKCNSDTVLEKRELGHWLRMKEVFRAT